jgi:hypothetical protein
MNYRDVDRIITGEGDCLLVLAVTLDVEELPVEWVVEQEGSTLTVDDDNVAFYLEEDDTLTLADLVEALGADWEPKVDLWTGYITL